MVKSGADGGVRQCSAAQGTTAGSGVRQLRDVVMRPYHQGAGQTQ